MATVTSDVCPVSFASIIKCSSLKYLYVSKACIKSSTEKEII